MEEKIKDHKNFYAVKEFYSPGERGKERDRGKRNGKEIGCMWWDGYRSDVELKTHRILVNML